MRSDVLNWMTAVQAPTSASRRSATAASATPFSLPAQTEWREAESTAHRTTRDRTPPVSKPNPETHAPASRDTKAQDGAKAAEAGRPASRSERAPTSDVRRNRGADKGPDATRADSGSQTDRARAADGQDETTPSASKEVAEAGTSTSAKDGKDDETKDASDQAGAHAEPGAAGTPQPVVAGGTPVPPAVSPASPVAAGGGDGSETAAVGVVADKAGRGAEGASAGAQAALAPGAAEADRAATQLADAGSGGASSAGADAAAQAGTLAFGLTDHAPTSSAAAHAANPAQPTQPATPLGSVPVEIGLRALAGTNRFDIRLDPVELGRIDVRLEIDKDKGTVKAHLTVDRPETLALLQRDTTRLGEALVQAGLTPGEGDINVSLRDTSQDTNRDGGQAGTGGNDGARAGTQAAAEADPVRPQAVWRGYAGGSGIDIRI